MATGFPILFYFSNNLCSHFLQLPEKNVLDPNGQYISTSRTKIRHVCLSVISVCLSLLSSVACLQITTMTYSKVQTEFLNNRQVDISWICLKRVYIWSTQLDLSIWKSQKQWEHRFTIKVNQNIINYLTIVYFFMKCPNKFIEKKHFLGSLTVHFYVFLSLTN